MELACKYYPDQEPSVAGCILPGIIHYWNDGELERLLVPLGYIAGKKNYSAAMVEKIDWYMHSHPALFNIRNVARFVPQHLKKKIKY